MLSKEKYDQLKFQIAAHKPLSSIVAMSVAQAESLFEMIDKLQYDYTAQSLALKAAKAMQQAETERADANEQDAKRYRWIRGADSRSCDDLLVKIASKNRDGWSYGTVVGNSLDNAIDFAMGKVAQ